MAVKQSFKLSFRTHYNII